FQSGGALGAHSMLEHFFNQLALFLVRNLLTVGIGCCLGIFNGHKIVRIGVFTFLFVANRFCVGCPTRAGLAGLCPTARIVVIALVRIGAITFIIFVAGLLFADGSCPSRGVPSFDLFCIAR